MDLHVFPIPIPPLTSLSTPSLWVFPVHQARALVSCIQPGLVISFTIDNIHVLMLFSQNIPPSAISLLSHHAEIYISAQPYSLLISVATNLFTNWIFLAGEPYLNCSSFTPQFTYLLTFQIN